MNSMIVPVQINGQPVLVWELKVVDLFDWWFPEWPCFVQRCCYSLMESHSRWETPSYLTQASSAIPLLLQYWQLWRWLHIDPVLTVLILILEFHSQPLRTTHLVNKVYIAPVWRYWLPLIMLPITDFNFSCIPLWKESITHLPPEYFHAKVLHKIMIKALVSVVLCQCPGEWNS